VEKSDVQLMPRGAERSVARNNCSHRRHHGVDHGLCGLRQAQRRHKQPDGAERLREGQRNGAAGCAAQRCSLARLRRGVDEIGSDHEQRCFGFRVFGTG
jgi:hypothetical protein